MWGAFVSFVALGWRYNSLLIMQGVLGIAGAVAGGAWVDREEGEVLGRVGLPGESFIDRAH